MERNDYQDELRINRQKADRQTVKIEAEIPAETYRRMIAYCRITQLDSSKFFELAVNTAITLLIADNGGQ